MERKIGYLEPEGTFSHEAAYLWVGETEGKKLIGLKSFESLIKAVAEKQISEAVIPVENSLIGGIPQVLDAIIKGNGQLMVKGEIILPIRQNLIVVCGKKRLQDITKVVSIKEATSQCEEWIRNNISHAKLEYVDSTATAIRNLASYGEGVAAIGSRLAAKLYNAEIVIADIHDNKDNATRFLVLAESDYGKITGDDKTLLIFSVSNKPGTLMRVLEVFDVLDINMTKIESRPSKRKLGEYIFWVEIDGHRREETIKVALKAVEKKTSFLKVLGSCSKYSV